jgi:SAM-dependent methyltransferase
MSGDPRPRKILLLGAGSSRGRRIHLHGDSPDLSDWGGELVTLDWNADHGVDVVHDLSVFPWPFNDDTFDRIDAYEVLEHLGRQGDFHGFFRDFGELWRILKPGGFLAATCPSYRSMWAWGDPSHTRILTSGSLVFLDQQEYRKQIGKTTMSDFRFCWQGDFERVVVQEDDEHLSFVLRAVKPSRIEAS